MSKYKTPARHRYFYNLLGPHHLLEDEYWLPWGSSMDIRDTVPVTRDEWLDMFFRYRNSQVLIEDIIGGRFKSRNTFYRNLRAYSVWVATAIASSGNSPRAGRTCVDRTGKYMKTMRAIARDPHRVGPMKPDAKEKYEQEQESEP